MSQEQWGKKHEARFGIIAFNAMNPLACGGHIPNIFHAAIGKRKERGEPHVATTWRTDDPVDKRRMCIAACAFSLRAGKEGGTGRDGRGG